MNAPQIVLLMLLVATLRGQEKDFSKAYPFTERKPKTKIETAIDRLLPSIVKVQGASGFATIESSASGLIVSKRGHILTLDQVLLQKGRTHVVLYDGSVHQAQLLPEDSKLGVRLLKIDPSEVAFGLLPVWPVVKSEPAFCGHEHFALNQRRADKPGAARKRAWHFESAPPELARLRGVPNRQPPAVRIAPAEHPTRSQLPILVRGEPPL